MIHKQTVINSAMVINTLDINKLNITPKANTVLQALVNATEFPFTNNTIIPEQELLSSLGNLLQDITASNVHGGEIVSSPHDLVQGGYIDDISKAVSAHVNFAKTVVMPNVVIFAEHIKSYKESISTDDASTGLNIIQMDIPSLVEYDFFLDSIAKYKNKTVLVPSEEFTFPSKDIVDVLALMLTGDKTTDKIITEWTSNPDITILVSKVWKSFFEKSTSDLNYNTIGTFNSFDKLNFALIHYLISNKLSNNVESGIEVTLTKYNTILNQYKEYSGSLLCVAIQQTLSNINNKRLILEVKDKVAKVNGVIYREWVKTTGMPQIIFGAIISDSNLNTLISIDQNKDKLLRSWELYETLYNANKSNTDFSDFKTMLILAFDSYLKDKSKDECDYIAAHPNHFQVVDKLVKEELAKLRLADMEDFYGISLNLVAKCRYYYTSAFSILSDIDTAQKVNPDVAPREAALIAVIKYLADYMFDQMSIKPV